MRSLRLVGNDGDCTPSRLNGQSAKERVKRMSDSYSYPMDSSKGGPKNIIRLVDGKPVKAELTEAESSAYTPPPDNKYHVKITGFNEPWQEPRKAEWITAQSPATHQTMTMIEFEVMEGRGKGKRFSSRVSCTVGPTSNLGKVWLAAVGPIPATVELTDILDKELIIYMVRKEDVDQSGNKVAYANPTWSTAKALSDKSEEDDAEGWPAA